MINEIRSQATALAATGSPRAAAPQGPQDCVSLTGSASETGLVPRPSAALLDRAQPGKPEYVPGQILVKFKPGVVVEDANLFATTNGLKVLRHFEVPPGIREAFGGELYQFKLPAGDTVAQAVARFSGAANVAYAEPNYLIKLDDGPSRRPAADPPAPPAPPPPAPGPGQVVPNDTDFPKLWGMQNTGQDKGTAGIDIDATHAWAQTTGKPNGQAPLLVIIDTGINYNHPDLSGNVATLPDGSHGKNIITKQPDPLDDNGHGSHCMGTIAGVGNNGQGVAGVNWTSNIASAKFLDAGGSGSYADAVDAVLYATSIGARLTSNSWGGGGFSQALHDAFKASPALHICAAGNESSDADQTPSYPSGFDKDLPNIISVAAIDRNGHLADFSNYGAHSVHLAAPGVDVYSTVLNNGYDTYSGTSMATPHVSGSAELIVSKFPNLTNDQIKARLVNSVTLEDELKGKVASGGRLNVAAALKDDNTPPANPADLKLDSATASALSISWTQPGDDGTSGGPSTVQVRISDKPIVESPQTADQIAWDAATPVNSLRADAGTHQQASLAVRPDAQPKTYYVALKAFDMVGNASGISSLQGTTQAAAIPFKDDFESPDSKWGVTGTWARVPADGHGNVYRTTAQGAYPDNADMSITSPAIDLSTVGKPQLMFDEKHDIEANYDFGRVEVSADGGKTWTEKAKYTGTDDWATRVLDLSDYEGKTVQVRFHFTSDGSIDKDGWYIDNVMVAGDPK